jgi:uncharacterized repeat protein (TIGR01451 family)
MKKSLLALSIFASLCSFSAFAESSISTPRPGERCRPHLVVHKIGPQVVMSGDEGRYRIEVMNVSRDCDARNVDVTDRLSAHTIFKDASSGGMFQGPDLGIFGGLVKWNNVNIEAGEHRIFEVRVRFITDRPHIAIDTGCALVIEETLEEHDRIRNVPACESAETQINPDNNDWDRSMPVSRG